MQSTTDERLRLRSSFLSVSELDSWLTANAHQGNIEHITTDQDLPFITNCRAWELLKSPREDHYAITLGLKKWVAPQENVLAMLFGGFTDTSESITMTYREYHLKIDEWPMLIIEMVGSYLYYQNNLPGHPLAQIPEEMELRFKRLFPRSSITQLKEWVKVGLLTNTPQSSCFPDLGSLLLRLETPKIASVELPAVVLE